MDSLSNRWLVSDPLFTAGPKGTFDDIAVKDPSIVHFDGKYHVFYTSICETTKSGYPRTVASVGYVCAAGLDALNQAPRTELTQEGKPIIAPQVFYFTPHKLWYLIAQVALPGPLGLQPVFLTNPDISDPQGWSAPEPFTYQRKLTSFWIDFWVICDETHAHFFYTDHDGRMFRQEAPLEKFPLGFGIEEPAVEVRGRDKKGPWRLHEASHIYKIRGEQRYLALLEAVRPHPLEPSYWDSRCRFMFAMEAESLRGPWKRVERSNDEFWGDPDRLVNAGDGTPSAYGQMSHPEAIRCGYDQRLEVDNDAPDLLFQAFDASSIDEHFRYDFLPWELALATKTPT